MVTKKQARAQSPRSAGKRQQAAKRKVKPQPSVKAKTATVKAKIEQNTKPAESAPKTASNVPLTPNPVAPQAAKPEPSATSPVVEGSSEQYQAAETTGTDSSVPEAADVDESEA